MASSSISQLCIVVACLVQIGLPLEYSPSRVYTYVYETEVRFSEPDLDKFSQAYSDVGVHFKSQVTLTPVWNQNNKMLVKLAFKVPQLQSIARPKLSQKLKSIVRFPLYFHWQGSQVRQVFIASKDATWSSNLKMGVASLLQLQRDNGERTEIDTSGKCTVVYEVEDNKITKTKSGCKSTQPANEFFNINHLLDVDLESTSQTVYEIAEDIIKSVTAEEHHTSRLNIRDSLASQVTARQKLTLEKTVQGAKKVQASTLEEAVQVISAREKLGLVPSQLSMSLEPLQCAASDCSSVADLVETYRDDLLSTNMATISSGQAHLHLVEGFRQASKDTIRNILKDEKNAEIIGPLIDAVVSAQTTAGQEALMEILDFSATYDNTEPERYLLAAAFSTHPTTKLLQDLLTLYKKNVPDERLQESVGEALGAVTYTYCQVAEQCSHKIVNEIQESLLEKLENCQKENCKLRHIRALTNAGLPDTLPHLLQCAETAKEASISEAAVKALHRIDRKLITPEVKDVLWRILLQKKRGFDSAVRTQALKVLLELEPSDTEVKDILEVTTDPSNTELDMYIQARLFTLAEANKQLREQIHSALQDEKLRNWNVLAPKGKSLAFKEKMAETRGMTATYDMYVENSKAGVMKRSGMDVDLIGQKQTLPLYSFGLYATGLEGLLGEEVEEGQEDAEATAGLALNLIDVSLRPVSFFTGQSGLMSAVWNAPSELVSALQVNLLLHDNARQLHLQNGLVVEHNVHSVVSMDLSGKISISLWNKNCQSLIKNSGALVIRGSLAINTPAFKTGIRHTADASAVIDFQTDVDFYDKIKMCLQMSKPASVFRHNVTKYEAGGVFKQSYHANICRSLKLNEESYPLPKPNNAQCRTLLGNF